MSMCRRQSPGLPRPAESVDAQTQKSPLSAEKASCIRDQCHIGVDRLCAPYFGGAGVKISRFWLASGFGFGLGAFFASFLPLSLFPMGVSLPQKGAAGKDGGTGKPASQPPFRSTWIVTAGVAHPPGQLSDRHSPSPIGWFAIRFLFRNWLPEQWPASRAIRFRGRQIGLPPASLCGCNPWAVPI